MGTKPSEHLRQRDEALYLAFQKVLRNDPSLTEDEAIAVTLRERQPRMWMSFYGVYRIVLDIARGKEKRQKHKARKGVFEEIKRKYERLHRASVFQNASSLFITSFIIAEPTEGFLVSAAYAKRIIWRVRKQRQSAWRKPRTT